MNPRLVVPDLVAHLLAEMSRDPSALPRCERLSNFADIWRRLLFCILSSQVKVESAHRAVLALMEDVPFDCLSRSEVFDRVRLVLRSAKVRYRFPDARSRQIADSWFAFAQVKDDFYSYLDSHLAEVDARVAVAERFSGLGMKQASMFLRDIGYSARLCIIDTHIVWYCVNIGLEPAGAITPRRYLKLEEHLLNESDALGVAPNMLDSAIWAAVKTFKSRQCMMQFA